VFFATPTDEKTLSSWFVIPRPHRLLELNYEIVFPRVAVNVGPELP